MLLVIAYTVAEVPEKTRAAMPQNPPVVQRLEPITVADSVDWSGGSDHYAPAEVMREATDPRWHPMIRGEAYDEVDGEPPHFRNLSTPIEAPV